MHFQCSYRQLCIILAINGLFNTPWSITTLHMHDKHTSEKALIPYLLYINAFGLAMSVYVSQRTEQYFYKIIIMLPSIATNIWN